MTLKALKISVLVNAAELIAFEAPNGGRFEIGIVAGGQRLTATITAKQLKKAQSATRVADYPIVILSGSLAGTRIENVSFSCSRGSRGLGAS